MRHAIRGYRQVIRGLLNQHPDTVQRGIKKLRRHGERCGWMNGLEAGSVATPATVPDPTPDCDQVGACSSCRHVEDDQTDDMRGWCLEHRRGVNVYERCDDYEVNPDMEDGIELPPVVEVAP